MTNRDSRSERQTVQLDLGYRSSGGEPTRQLKAFAKVELAHATRTVHLRVGPTGMRVFDTDTSTTPNGRFMAEVGTSARDLPRRLSFRR